MFQVLLLKVFYMISWQIAATVIYAHRKENMTGVQEIKEMPDQRGNAEAIRSIAGYNVFL